jgi:glycerol-3-phosphate dehydrogenase (NAD(P)+)
MAAARENSYSLPGVAFPDDLDVAAGFTAAASAGTVVIAVASEYLRTTGRLLAPAVPAGTVLVSVTKGLEHGSALRGSEVLAQEMPHFAARICVLSGPNLAGEDRGLAAQAAGILGTRLFRLYTTDDLIGVELGGSLKNVVALAAGVCDGLGMGVNAKAAIVTRGMAEIVRLGVACGAHAQTFAGLSGFGDLFATCTSVSSRNHYVGEQLSHGRSLQAILDGMHMVAEGVATAPAALALAARYGIDLPITAEVCAVLFDGKEAGKAMDDLLARLMRDERTGEVL